MTNSKVTEDNWLDTLESMSALEAFELVATIIDCFTEESESFETYMFEKPWKYPEIFIPALNGELEGRVTEILMATMAEAL